MLLNVSNHPSELWGSKQLDAAHQYGGVVDIPFPPIPAETTSIEIERKVEEYLQKIRAYTHPIIMVQGEFVFNFRIVSGLKKQGYGVVASVSERVAREEQDENGVETKTSTFEFRGFWEY